MVWSPILEWPLATFSLARSGSLFINTFDWANAQADLLYFNQYLAQMPQAQIYH